ncbi:MAG: PQQ-binding-like beta-propeller repeat protein, partial [Pirellulaceae bacterium]
DDLNPRGVPLRELYADDPGRGAREWAELRKEVLEAEGHSDVAVELITVPRTTIYALSGAGGIHAIDAETGETRWTAGVGEPFQPTFGLAANNNRVIAVRGSKVHCLDARDGRKLWQRTTKYAPGGGVAISDHFAYVTSIEGHLQMFPLNSTGLPERFFASSGPATYDPTVTSETVSWSTRRGYYNVSRSQVASLMYRLQTDDEFMAPGASVGDYLVANSTTGKVYAIDEMRGSLVWDYAVGERLDKKPIAIGNNTLLVITANNNLVALDNTTGQVANGWPKQVGNVAEYVGASQNVLYFLNSSGQLVGLRRDSGSLVASTPIGERTPLANAHTDRLYLTDAAGSLICMRELANFNPVVHGDDFVLGGTAEEATPQTEEPVKPAETTDPFGDPIVPTDPNDPFGDPAPSGESGDMQPGEPSGQGNDPFGDDQNTSGDDNKPEDPFGEGGDG